MLEQIVRKVKYGNNIRYTFGQTEENTEQMGYLLDLQKNSYNKFIAEGIGEVLKEFSPITDYSGKAEVYFLDYKIEERPKLSKAETKRKSSHYTVALRVKVRLVIKETGEAIENEVFLGDVPYMTPQAASAGGSDGGFRGRRPAPRSAPLKCAAAARPPRLW